MIYETIGKNIKHFRTECKMTQGELADLLFISPQMISRYENHMAAPDVATVAKLCSVFHISMDVLCGLDRTSKDRSVGRLAEKYSGKTPGDFSVLRKQYEEFLKEAAEYWNDDRIMKIQLSLLEELHDRIENENHHREINEQIFECATRILDLSRDEELRSSANYRMAIYFSETPFEDKNYQKNLSLSREYLKKVLLCTYFPEYTPFIGMDVRSETYTQAQTDNIAFFANKLYHAIQQFIRKNTEKDSFSNYNALLCHLATLLGK